MRSAIFAGLFAFVLATPAAAQDPDQGAKETETVDRTLSLQPGGTVRLKTFSGRVNMTGTGGNQVVIKAVRRATRERLNDIKLEITQSGSVIEIDANHRVVERRNDNVIETDFDIQVPHQVRLDLRTFSAPVTVTNVAGNLEVEGFSSDVHLTQVAGPVRAKTFSGAITVQAQTWNDGDDFDIDTFSGDVILRAADSVRGSITFESFSGNFQSELPVTLASSNKRNFRGSLNGGGNTDLRFKTFSGDVSIRR